MYLDLKQNLDGTRFLSISELSHSRSRERSRILVDEEYVAELHRALGAVLELLGSEVSMKSYKLQEKQREHARAYKPWTKEEEQQLKTAYT